jgi:hypothetical protein
MTESTLFDARPLEARIDDAWRRFAVIRPKSPIVRHDSPITSRLVAERLAESDRFRLRLEVLLQAVCDAGDDGIIDDDLIMAFPDWPPSSVTATMSRLRDWELVKAGPDTRPTRYGNAARVNRVW